MRNTIFILFQLVSMQLPAQWVQRSEYFNKPLGWIKVYNWKGATKPLQIDHRNYSIAQLSVCDSFANWIQLSYLPTGALGDVRKAASDKLTNYNQNTKSLPQSYGAYAKIYLDLKKGPDGKLVPYDNTGYQWNIMANAKLGDCINVISTPEQYYFFIPRYSDAELAGNEFAIAAQKKLDLSQHPMIKKYTWYFQPKGILTDSRMVVLLCRNNELPYVQITKGEYIEQMSAAVERKFNSEKEYALKGWPEGNARNVALKAADENYRKRTAMLNKQREKYKDRMQEKASVFTEQPSELVEQYEDLFEGNNQRDRVVPVYKFDPVKVALCQKDQPQWIAIFWYIVPGYDQDPSNNNYEYAAVKVMHESILQHFNFDYAYNFFFDPEKVKGQAYKPLPGSKY
ncbi:hypothetical protein [Flavihumibacter fluvii]|uniref:hypothetical protein n=1 Tax=Flavihumibacter fluvii TaxID=2838157 RepID=UPI001BDDE05E|nr:hypothetical protein [Flavihumibacter fluvii]ULQ53331.1 hypothetical protein KJS93_03245 [Flavihumibacter fluvii]